MKITKTSITVRDIEVFARHGVLAQEKVVGNEYFVTVTLDFDASRAIVSDDVGATVNYAAVVDVVRATMCIPSALLEHVTGRIIAKLVETFPSVLSGTVTVTKRHPPFATPTAGASFTASFEV